MPMVSSCRPLQKMGVKALNWAYSQQIKNPAKAVLCALAYRENGKTGQCNPSISRIAQDTGLGKTAVKSAIRALSEIGAIEVVSGSRTSSNSYILGIGAGGGSRDGLACRSRGGPDSRSPDGLGGGSRGDVGRETTQGRSPDDHKQEENISISEGKNPHARTHARARGLRVIGSSPFGEGV